MNRSHTFLQKAAIRNEKCFPCGQDIEFCKQILKCKDCKVVCHIECKNKVSPTMYCGNQFHIFHQKTAIRNEKCFLCGQDIKFCKQVLRCTACSVTCHPECKNEASPFMQCGNHFHTLLQKTALCTEKCSQCCQDIKFRKKVFKCTGCSFICHPECKDKVFPAVQSDNQFHTLLQKTAIRTEKCTSCERDIKFCTQIMRCTGCRVICHLECKDQVTPAMHCNNSEAANLECGEKLTTEEGPAQQIN